MKGSISRLAAAAILPALAPVPWHAATPATLVVPTDYATIQGAIDAANPLDDVVVEPGTYTENLILRSEVDVRGREAARTLLEPDDENVATVTIAVADDLRFSNFTLINASTAIEVTLAASVQISNVVFDSAVDAAIDVDAGSTVDVTNNVFFENGTAILRNTTEVYVTNNIFLGNETTITTLNPLIGNDVNVDANCWFDNADLLVGGIDSGYGTDAVVGEPRFVDPAGHDFHLELGSPCIDIGDGTDGIDGTAADAGAYGGQFADARPYPVAAPTLTDASTDSPAALNVQVEWPENSSYLVTNPAQPGSYALYYKQGSSGPPYDGIDAGAGMEPSPIDVGSATTHTLRDLLPSTAAPGGVRLLTAEGRNEGAILTWEPAAGASGYRIHYGIAATSEHQIDTGNVTTFAVTGLSNGSTYRFAVGAVARATYYVAVTARDNTAERHESAFSTEQSIEIGTGSEGPLSNELTALPEFLAGYPILPDEDGCFIATAAYGADWQAEVRILRAFRDRYLATHTPGRWLIAQYYRLSPPIADELRRHAGLRAAVRWLLTPLVGLALLLLASSAPAKLAAGAVLVVLVARARRRRNARRSAAAPGPSVALVALAWLTVSSPADAQSGRAPLDAPRWTYELRVGEYEPDLALFSTFYGDSKETAFALAGTYRFRDWLELGGEYGYMKATGVGFLTSSQQLGGTVDYRLNPLQVYANFVFQREARQRVVPYVGIGVATALYEQEIELQPDVDGRTDLGWSARAGLRFFLTSHGPITRSSSGSPHWRSYLLLEAQDLTAEVDDVDLGGTAYVLGYRMEFDFQ